MPAPLDLRPAALDVLFRPSNPATVTMTWPAGSLTGRTFTASVGGAAWSLDVAGDLMTVSATEAQTTTAGLGKHTFVLTETTGGGTDDLIVGVWMGTDDPSVALSTSVTVAVSAGSVTVDVSGQAALTAFSNRATLETLGAVIDQTAAQTMDDRFLTFIRTAGGGSPPATWKYKGGDITDGVFIAASADALWIGADWLDGGTVEADDTYSGTLLPVRNGAIFQPTPGAFQTGTDIQLFQTGTSGVWINAVAQGGLAAGTIWWPIAGLDDNGTTRVVCWHVDASATTPYGTLLDSHIVTLNAFGGYASHVTTGIGSVTDNFWIDGLLRDSSFTYIYGEQFIPDYDADLLNDGTVPNYGKSDPQNHYTIKRVARVTNGQLTTPANWTYWNGTSWVPGAANATPMVDSNGNQVQGDAGVTKIATGRYLLVAHRLTDSHVNVYRSANPQGPWTQISRVPTPFQGHVMGGGTQIGQLTKILPSQLNPSGVPAEHSIAMISRNLLFPTDPMADHNIRRYAPQFVVVPHY